jgi:HPt (histidine-containing phosphotransfer) domain-containing protein
MIVQVDQIHLLELGDRALIEKRIEWFAAASAEQLGALRSAALRASPRELVQAAHALKGACRSMSAHTAAELAEMVERAALAARLRPVPELCRRLDLALRESEAQMRGLLRCTAPRRPVARASSNTRAHKASLPPA